MARKLVKLSLSVPMRASLPKRSPLSPRLPNGERVAKGDLGSVRPSIRVRFVSAVLIRKGTLGVPCGLKSNSIFGSFKKLGLLTIALMLFVVLPKLMDIMDISKMDQHWLWWFRCICSTRDPSKIRGPLWSRRFSRGFCLGWWSFCWVHLCPPLWTLFPWGYKWSYSSLCWGPCLGLHKMAHRWWLQRDPQW